MKTSRGKMKKEGKRRKMKKMRKMKRIGAEISTNSPSDCALLTHPCPDNHMIDSLD